MAILFSSLAWAFDKRDYYQIEMDKFVQEKLTKVHAEIKAARDKNIAMSFNTAPGQRIKVNGVFDRCEDLGDSLRYFIRKGQEMNLMTKKIIEDESRSCFFKVDGVMREMLATTEGAKQLNENFKGASDRSGVAFLQYFGTSAGQGVFLLKHFAIDKP